jgi:hypothetical protein
VKLLEIFRTYFNYCEVGKDKKTPAMRLGLAKGPIAPEDSGAFIIAPSMLCHRQAMPSNSSYSARPDVHKASKTPAFSHSKKRPWIALALRSAIWKNTIPIGRQPQ